MSTRYVWSYFILLLFTAWSWLNLSSFFGVGKLIKILLQLSFSAIFVKVNPYKHDIYALTHLNLTRNNSRLLIVHYLENIVVHRLSQ